MAKEHRVMFRVDESSLKIMEKLGNKLSLGRGELLRFCLENTAERFLDFEATLIVIERERWAGIVNMLEKMFVEKVYDYQKDLSDKFEKVKDEIIKKISENPEVVEFIKKIDKQ